MSRSPLVWLSALLSAGLLCSVASAQTADPFAGADCREAKLDRVIGGRVQSSETVVICKRTEPVRAALRKEGFHFALPPGQATASPDKRNGEHVAFTSPVTAGRECAMLNCPTYVLTGIGD